MTQSEIAKVFYECKTRKMKLTRRALFNYFGENIYSDNSEQEWRAVIPDTFAEVLYCKICKV